MQPTIGKDQKIRFKVNGIRNLSNGKVYSEGLQTGDLVWKVCVNVEQNCGKKFNVFLVCEFTNEKQNWICEVNAEVSLVKQVGNGPNMDMNLVHSFDFHNREKKLEFCAFETINTYENGFEIDKNVIIEVEFDYKYYNFSELSPGFTDRLITVQDIEFKVSKMQLASVSQYFYQLFITDNYSEANLVWNEEITTAVDFLQFLAAVQSNPIKVTLNNYDSLIKSAKRFGAIGLHAKCEEFLINSGLDMYDKLKYVDQYDYSLLKRHCVKFIDNLEYAKIISINEKFEELSLDTKFRILKRGMNIV